MSVNICVFTGNLTRDPELRHTPDGNTTFCKFGLAVNTGWGEKQKTSFINMTAFNKTAEAIANYIGKGAKVTVRSHVQTGSYEKQDGTKVYTTDFIVDEIEFPSKKESEGQAKPQGNFEPEEDVFTPVDDEDIDGIPF